MATIHFTPHLKRYFDVPGTWDVEAETLADVVRKMDETWPGLAFYVVEETGTIRQHVAVWVDGTLLTDRSQLSTPLGAASVVHILQALSGG